MLGPVQVLVLTVADDQGRDDVVASLSALGPDAPVRLLEAFEVAVAEDGSISVISDADDPPATVALFVRPDDADANDVDEPATDVWHLGEVVPPGSTAVVALLEHRWATPLRDVLTAAGGAVSHETWLDPEDRGALEALLGS